MDGAASRAWRQSALPRRRLQPRQPRRARHLRLARSDRRICVRRIREAAALFARAVFEISQLDVVAPASRRRTHRRDTRLLRAAGARRRIRSGRESSQRRRNSTGSHRPRRIEDRCDGSRLRIRQRRWNFRTEPVHWRNGGRVGGKPGASHLPSIDRRTGGLCSGRNGRRFRWDHPHAADFSDNDLRVDARLHYHRPTDDLEPDRIFHLAEVAA